MTAMIPLRKLLETYDPSSQMSWEFLNHLYLTTQRPRMIQLMDSIQAAGIQSPIVLDDETRTVWDGQHRVIAAVELELDELPWIPSSQWDEVYNSTQVR